MPYTTHQTQMGSGCLQMPVPTISATEASALYCIWMTTEEGFFIFVMVFVLALTPLLLWVMPLQQAMIAVKKARA